ncbi:MAG: hydrogenase formation protein HypD [Spirochaetae bacterium HGW-Spirochaetae-1]|jgi:hydrogenase expression/formation protein HypD|nr:MAG: hydrogenase formation protein HypD [Spirochaetae bacterium HGW-Spirochaetae-1]
MNKETIKQLARRLTDIKLDHELRIMEVCGTHTAEFFKSGVKDIFPQGLTLIDGPGCPVCVTANEYLDRAIQVGKEHNAILTTFGDMIKVPSSYSSLGRELGDGMDIRVVYSPLESLDIAVDNPGREVVFLSVGFETTAPTQAAAVMEAKKRNISNFSILPGNKLTPPAVAALLSLGEVRIDGFILPGHVSAILGSEAWRFIVDDFHKPCVIAGFETPDLLTGTISLVEILIRGELSLVNEYPVIVKKEGNVRAREIMYEVFEKSDATWRGIGVIPESGLSVREGYADFDASRKLHVTPPEPKEHAGCKCGELLRGLILPPDCPLFAKACSPERPVGPCMVSTEGPCSAYYKYWRK